MRPSSHMVVTTVLYFLILALESSCRSSSTRATSGSNSSLCSSASSTVALRRSGMATPCPCSQVNICSRLLGFSRPVSSMASCLAASSIAVPQYSAPSTSSLSAATPRALIRISYSHSRCTCSGTGNRLRRRSISISVTTSCRLYSTNNSHFAGSCSGRLRVLPPLVIVLAHGVQKYLIRALPVVSFCTPCGRPSALPAASRLAGYPQYRLCSIVQRHCSSGSSRPKCLPSAYHSNAALKACLM